MLEDTHENRKKVTEARMNEKLRKLGNKSILDGCFKLYVKTEDAELYLMALEYARTKAKAKFKKASNRNLLILKEGKQLCTSKKKG